MNIGPGYALKVKRCRGRLGYVWHLDEVFVTNRGKRQYRWRAVDHDGDLIDILPQRRRNRRAAEKRFRKLLDKERSKLRAHACSDQWTQELLDGAPLRDAVGAGRHDRVREQPGRVLTSADTATGAIAETVQVHVSCPVSYTHLRAHET